MPITILDYVKTVVGDKGTYTADDFAKACVEMMGGCHICGATIAPYNAHPSKSGYWRCPDCIGDDGFTTVDKFVEHENTAIAAAILNQYTGDWSPEELQDALSDLESTTGLVSSEPDLNCPSCGAVENITEVWENAFQCRDCGAAWRL